MKINANERKCLEVLALEFGSDQNFCYFRALTTPTGLTLKQVRRAVRSLARKGFTEYARGLFDEDGAVAGSGYACTKAGYDFLIKGGWNGSEENQE